MEEKHVQMNERTRYFDYMRQVSGYVAYHILVFILLLMEILGNSPTIITKGLVIGDVCIVISFDMVYGPESLLVVLPVIIVVRDLSI